MKKKYIVTLTEEEHEYLEDIVTKGKSPAYRIKHARILLNADVSGSDKSDGDIADLLHCHINTAENVRQRFVEQGPEFAPERKNRDNHPIFKKIDGGKEAYLTATDCSAPPEGYSRRTLQMLADKIIVDSVSRSAVVQTLKKTD